MGNGKVKKFSIGPLARLRGQANSFYVLVNEMYRVVQAGKVVKGNPDRVFLIVIPTLPEISPFFKTSVLLRSPKVVNTGNSWRSASVKINLTVHLKSTYFDPLEVVDQYRTTFNLLPYTPNRIDVWIGELFEKAAMENEAVKGAFSNFLANGNQFQLLGELAKALRNIKFSGKPLSNISEINAEIRLGDISLVAKERIVYQ